MPAAGRGRLCEWCDTLTDAFPASKATSRSRVSPKNRTGRVVPGGDARSGQAFYPHGIHVHPKRACG
jgi:hypothetical protein